MILPKRLPALLTTFLLLLTGCGGSPSVAPPGAALHFRLPAVGGGYFSSRELRGRPAIVEIFAVWCRYCGYQAEWELPELFAWARAHRVGVVLVSGSDGGGLPVPGPRGRPWLGTDGSGRPFKDAAAALRGLAAFRRRFGISVPVLYDLRLALYRQLRVRTFPTTIVLNGRGQPVGEFAGIGQNSAVEERVGNCYKLYCHASLFGI